jgi:hypothetical protein
MSPRSQKGELMLFGSLVSICTLTRLLFSSFIYIHCPSWNRLWASTTLFSLEPVSVQRSGWDSGCCKSSLAQCDSSIIPSSFDGYKALERIATVAPHVIRRPIE